METDVIIIRVGQGELQKIGMTIYYWWRKGMEYCRIDMTTAEVTSAKHAPDRLVIESTNELLNVACIDVHFA